jgi:hypothetical protein
MGKAKDIKVPKFTTIEEEQQYWQTHDAFEVLGEESWEAVEEGTTEVRSFYVSRAGKAGVRLLLPRELLERLGIRPGQKVQASIEDDRLIIQKGSQ